MRLCPALVIVMVASSPAFAQDRDLTPADSAALRVATLGVLLDSAGPADAREMRIWIQAPATRPPMSEGVWQAVSDSFPAVRLVQAGDTVFICPEGRNIAMT